MNSVEDQIRAATRAQASTLREVRPLRLAPAPARLPRRGRARPALRWRGWLAPVTTAVLVIAVAVALVVVRDIPNGGGVPPSAAQSAASAPPYFVALFHPGKSLITSSGLVIGDTRTGARLATMAAPHGSRFAGVTAAADDRTFVVATMPIAHGNKPALAVTWYLLRIGPGRGYTLAKLAIPDMHAWGVQGIALSPSGRELAMTLVPASYHLGGPGWVLRIYSVGTGKLLRSWSAGSVNIFTPYITIPGDMAHPLNWADGDRAVAFQTFSTPKPGSVSTGSERLIDVSARSGDLLAASRVVWSGKDNPGTYPDRCDVLSPQVTTDGKTVVCFTGPVYSKQGARHVTLRWLAFSIAAPTAAPRVLYRVTANAPSPDFGLSSVLWSDATGRTLIVEWAVGRGITASDEHLGVVSNGVFHPLPSVPNYVGDWPAVAW